MRLGAAKRLVETKWTRKLAYALLGEPHVPGWIRLKHVLRELQKLDLDGPPVRVLDAGCSRGDLITYLAERRHKWSFVGIELEEDRLRKAEEIRQKLGLKNVSYVQSDICALPLQSEFDLVLCSDVLEHIPDDRAAVVNLIQALKPGGYIIITSPSIPQPWHLPLVVWRERRIGFDRSEYGHVRQGYSASDLETILFGAGAGSVRVRYTYGRWGTLSFDLFFSIGDSKPNPFVFALFYPLLKILGWLDLRSEPHQGAGVLAVGRKCLGGPKKNQW
jgi:SAM-dependent methyltransferase